MKISVIGCTGRMGKTIISQILDNDSLILVGGYGKNQHGIYNGDLGELVNRGKININATKHLDEIISQCDALIDFSSPELSLQAAYLAQKHQKIYVCGTTGFGDNQFATLESYATNSPFLWSSNMSIGVNLLNKLVKQASLALDESFDVEILEMHHRYKKDSPSGTAISLGKTVANAKKINFNKHSVLSRAGILPERAENEIGFATLRGGSVIGDHSVIFASDYEKIEISHKALDRGIFASGAIKAAIWLQRKESGLYSIDDMV